MFPRPDVVQKDGEEDVLRRDDKRRIQQIERE